ncbi:MAG: class I SAM-dependent methyltransferase [Flavobacteriales bacterium]|nr:class I SAM-dependent methyltransferase [Flavobacteriales bacterium]
MNSREKNKQPWPTKDAMQQIYELNLWGGEDGNFYSGLGSHDKAIVEPYIEVVKVFLNSLDVPVTIVDLGCGDFNVGKELVTHSQTYIAVDIVPELIERNREKFILENLSFQCLDIAKDELPIGDVALVRQVLQHLSNAEVKQVVEKLDQYQYVILTEHLPEGEFEPNVDIISGQGIRLKKGSGLDLIQTPFEFKAKVIKKLLSIPYPDGIGVIVTTLFGL